MTLRIRGGVDRKLSLARQLLSEQLHQLIHQLRLPPSTPTALVQGALYHLESAYRLHLRGLAEGYECGMPAGVTSVQTLLAALAERGRTAPEAQELADLEAGDSWLAALLSAHRQLGEVSVHAARAEGENLIPLRPGAGGDPTLARVREWLQRLEELVERHHDLMREW